MPEKLPYRRPCQGKHIPRCDGLFFRHKKVKDDGVDRFINTTMVPNYDTIAGGTIPPYERLFPDPDPLGGGCEVYGCNEEGLNLKPCTPWQRPFPMHVWTKTGTVNFSQCAKRGRKSVFAKRAWNGRFGYKNIEDSGGVDTWLPCDPGAAPVIYRSAKAAPLRTRYRKIVNGATWNQDIYTYDGGGTPTIVSRPQSASITEEIDAGGIENPSALSVIPNESGPFTQFALALLAVGFYSWSDVVSNFVHTTTGVGAGRTVTWTGTSITVTNDADSAVMESVTWDVAAGQFRRTVTDFGDGPGVYLTTLVESYDLTDTTLAYSRTETTYTTGAGGNVVDSIRTSTVSATLSSAVTDADIYADIVFLLGKWDLTDDKQYPWRTDLKVGIAPKVSRDELATTVFDASNFFVADYGAPVTDVFGNTLGDESWIGDTGYTVNPNPASGLAKISINYGGGNLGVDASQTLAGFGHCATVSFEVVGGSFPSGVSLNSATGEITGTIGDNGHWGVTILITGAAPEADGSVLGAPMPAGYENYFDWSYLEMHACCFRDVDTGLVAFNWFQYGEGGTVADFNSHSGCNLPLTATQWTNWLEAENKPQGGFLMYADPESYFPGGCVPSNLAPGLYLGDGNFWGGKYAEALETWYSENFARPAGDDKYTWDEDHVYCITNAAGSGEGSTWNLTDTISGSAPPDGTDFSGSWGGPSVDGFYAVASYLAGVVTLGAKAHEIPTNFKSRSHDDQATAFGKMRFPGVPAILGRAAVAWVSNESPIMIVLDKAVPSLRTGESVDITEVHDITAANNTFTVTRIDDKTFTLGGSTGNLPSLFMAPPSPAGLLVAGNIDLNHRPLVQDGGTVKILEPSIISEAPNEFFVIPTVNAATKTVMSPAAALDYFHTTGEHLGKFNTSDAALRYGVQVQDYVKRIYGQKAWAISTGNPNKYYMNDNDPKGDHVVLEFESDFRSPGEAARIDATADCSGTTSVGGGPTTNAGGGPVTLPFKSFTQTQGCLGFSRCEPMVVCVSPNGEKFKNGVTYGFPGYAGSDTTLPVTATGFVADAQYGSKWWFYVQSTMTDLLWQKPHRPCNIESCARWEQDNGECLPDADGQCPGDDDYDPEHSVPPVYRYEFFPLVEARIEVPCKYGLGENECATLNGALSIGWASPVFHTEAEGAALPPKPPRPADDGVPGGGSTAWDAHGFLCQHMAGCRFNYLTLGCVPATP